MLRLLRLIALTLLWTVAARSAAADIRVDRRTTMTIEGPHAAQMARLTGTEGVLRSVIVKAHRRVIRDQFQAEIVDLNEQVVYALDLRKKTYTRTTFAELRVEQGATEGSRQTTPTPEETAAADAAMADMAKRAKDFRMERRRKATGRRQTINGFDAQEVVSTLTIQSPDSPPMTVTTTEWLATDIPGYSEIEAFEEKYAELLGRETVRQMSARLEGQLASGDVPESYRQLMANNINEDDGTVGIPVLRITVQGGSRTPDAEKSPNSPKRSRLGAIGGALRRGTIGGPPPADEVRRHDFVPPSTVRDEIVNISTVVSGDDVAIPSDFRLVAKQSRVGP